MKRTLWQWTKRSEKKQQNNTNFARFYRFSVLCTKNVAPVIQFDIKTLRIANISSFFSLHAHTPRMRRYSFAVLLLLESHNNFDEQAWMYFSMCISLAVTLLNQFLFSLKLIQNLLPIFVCVAFELPNVWQSYATTHTHTHTGWNDMQMDGF